MGSLLDGIRSLYGGYRVARGRYTEPTPVAQGRYRSLEDGIRSLYGRSRDAIGQVTEPLRVVCGQYRTAYGACTSGAGAV